jgi:hypothetical protein
VNIKSEFKNEINQTVNCEKSKYIDFLTPNNVKNMLSFLSGASHEQLARSSKGNRKKLLMTSVI